MKIQTAVDYYGNQKKLAAALHVSKQAITNWKKESDLVPEGRAYQLQVITGGDLTVDPAVYNGST